MTVYILGGGPAGLAVADGLADQGEVNFMLIERGATLGGLAQTLRWDGVGLHDLGPHKIFTLDDGLMRRVMSLLPAEDWLTRDKVSSIYMNGHFLPYPPSPFSLAGVFGLPTFMRLVAGFGFARLRAFAGSNEPQTFEEDLTARLGTPLYRVLFEPIALKLWGPPSALDVKLSKGRVQTPSVIEVIARLLKLKSSSEFEALTFRYPKGGLGRIWAAIESKVRTRGKFELGKTVSGLALDGDRIRTIHLSSKDGAQESLNVGADDFVVSTLPIALTTELLGSALPSDVLKTARDIVALNDLVLVFVHTDQANFMDDSWVFVPDPKIIFHRVSEQESFDPGMVPSGSIVCCEVMSSAARPMSAKPDQELIDRCVADLRTMGYKDFQVLAARVIRLPKSYPVYRVGYEAGLAHVTDALDRIKNFKTVGRQGSFNYIGTLDAMDIGYGFARWYKDPSSASWQSERARTSHYPVLD